MIQYDVIYYLYMMPNFLTHPFVLALKEKKLELISSLLENGMSIHDDHNVAIRYASYYCSLEENVFLLNHGASPNANFNEPLINAAHVNNIELVKYLIKLGADVHYHDDETPYGLVGVAASNGYLELLHYFVSLDCDIHLWNDKALYYALYNENYDCADYLMSIDTMNLHIDNENIFLHACQHNKSNLLVWLFEHVDYFSTEKVGFHHVCFNRYKECFDVFQQYTKLKPTEENFYASCHQEDLSFSQIILSQFDNKWLEKNYQPFIFCMKNAYFTLAEDLYTKKSLWLDNIIYQEKFHEDLLYSLESNFKISIPNIENLPKTIHTFFEKIGIKSQYIDSQKYSTLSKLLLFKCLSDDTERHYTDKKIQKI